MTAGALATSDCDGVHRLLLVLFVLPAIEGAAGLFNKLVLLFLKPTRLVGYEFKEGVPARRARWSSCRR